MIVIKRNPNSILIMSPNSLSSFSTVTSLLSYFLHLHPMFQYQNDYRSRHLIFPENSLLLITAFFNHRFYTTMLIMSPILIFFLEKIGVVTWLVVDQSRAGVPREENCCCRLNFSWVIIYFYIISLIIFDFFVNNYYFLIIKNFRKKPVRVFHSAAITKRYDVFTLQTADGVNVLLQGYINRTLTVENGFSSQVFFFLFYSMFINIICFSTSHRTLS
jgi:hypothetical protein